MNGQPQTQHPNTDAPAVPRPVVQPDASGGGLSKSTIRQNLSFSEAAAAMGVIRRKPEKSRSSENPEAAQPAPEEKILHLSSLTGSPDDEPKSELARLRKELEQMENEREEWLRAIAELLEEERELQMALELAEARMVPTEWIELALGEMTIRQSASTASPETLPPMENQTPAPATELPPPNTSAAAFLEKISHLQAQLSAACEREAQALARADALEARLKHTLEQINSLKTALDDCRPTDGES